MFGAYVSDLSLGVIFAFGIAASLASSWVLVAALERVGARLGLTEALLGMLAALAANAPEITTAVTALVRNDSRIGAGVIIGSNVFNLAALLGLAAALAGQIALHRRVIELGGAVALWVSLVCLAVVSGLLSPLGGLLAALAGVAPYLVVLGIRHERLARLRLPLAWRRWLAAAISEEEAELKVAIHPPRGTPRDGVIAIGAVLVVVGASIAMERAGAELGTRAAIPEIVVGAIVLAAVTSLPNAVAAIYLAHQARGTAVLSTALNSNALNVVLGLLLPTTILGLGSLSAQTTFVAASYLAMTVLSLALAYVGRGLSRRDGLLVLTSYLAFAVALVAMAA
jgi:cation:H+ antiporter